MMRPPSQQPPRAAAERHRPVVGLEPQRAERVDRAVGRDVGREAVGAEPADRVADAAGRSGTGPAGRAAAPGRGAVGRPWPAHRPAPAPHRAPNGDGDHQADDADRPAAVRRSCAAHPSPSAREADILADGGCPPRTRAHRVLTWEVAVGIEPTYGALQALA